MKNKITLVLLICFIVCTHLRRDYKTNIISTTGKVVMSSLKITNLGASLSYLLPGVIHKITFIN